MASPVRRPEPGDPAALLVDQHRRIGAADTVAQRSDQVAKLRRLAAVAAEQDEAQRVGLGKKAALGGAEAFAGTAENDGSRARPI